jgi:hypothetical protein
MKATTPLLPRQQNARLSGNADCGASKAGTRFAGLNIADFRMFTPGSYLSPRNARRFPLTPQGSPQSLAPSWLAPFVERWIPKAAHDLLNVFLTATKGE